MPDKDYDYILNLLISISDNDTPVPITLNVSGLLITGEIIGEVAYRKEVMFGQLEAGLQAAVTKLKESGEWVEPEDKPDDPDDVEFIHLRNAKFFAPGQPPIPTQGDGTLWRGRLDAVDGYVFGTLAQQPL